MPLVTTPPRRLRFSAHLALTLVAATSLISATTHAAEPVTWKFEVGGKNRYRMTQHMVLSMDLGAGGKESQDITNVIDMSWVVDKVNDDGSALITQKIDRMHMTVKPPQGDAVEFDSRSTEEPQGFAAMVAPLFREMTRAEFTLTMSARGKVSNVKVPDALIAAIAAAPGAAMMGELATAKGLEETMSRMSFELPETLESTDPWTITTEMPNPILGTQTIKITYSYAGGRDVDGVVYEVFKPTLEINFAGGSATAKVESQTTTGEVLFNRTAGRLESTTLDHTMNLELAAAGQTIKQSIKQETVMKWLPEDAE